MICTYNINNNSVCCCCCCCELGKGSILRFLEVGTILGKKMDSPRTPLCDGTFSVRSRSDLRGVDAALVVRCRTALRRFGSEKKRGGDLLTGNNYGMHQRIELMKRNGIEFNNVPVHVLVHLIHNGMSYKIYFKMGQAKFWNLLIIL